MDLRQLRYFIAVVRERNFTRAAEQLNIAQPPLSRQIQLLEDEVGVPLLIRNSRPVQVTDAGRLFYEQAIQVLGRTEQMKVAARHVGIHQRRVLSIGFVASTLYGGLPILMRKLRQHAPDLDIQIVELMSTRQIQALKEGRIDIGFGRLHQSDPDIVSIVLEEEPLAIAAPVSSDIARESTPLPIEALAGQNMIVYPKEPRPGFADHVLNMFYGHGIQLGEVLEVGEIQAALGLVAAEFGMCVIPLSACQMRHDVHCRPIDGIRATSPVILSHRVNDRSEYIDLIKRLGQEIYTSDRSRPDAS
ncbi:LysR family transcriptional regulator [Paraburkholderia diazotrophica]|uniref:LysR family transcriptional regulator n=1 Tax=Paraburkholderia diazotrophica TaxID=667676 RepID=UPI003172E11A